MSDHISGPRAMADPIADITDLYAFPSPEGAGQLVLVLNTMPFAQPSSRLSDGLIYRLRVRRLTQSARTDPAPFSAAKEEFVVDCVFSAPVGGDGAGGLQQDGACTTPAGDMGDFGVHDDRAGTAHRAPVSAGPR